MPPQLSYPGVYIEEAPTGVRTIIGAATSITAFVGSAPRGLADKPVSIFNFGEFERKFGELDVQSALGYMVQQYFVNGGSEALIVRVYDDATAVAASADVGGLPLSASSPGTWGNFLSAEIDHETKPSTDTTLFNLTIEERREDGENGEDGSLRTKEKFLNISADKNSPRFLKIILDQQSDLVDLKGDAPTDKPSEGQVEFEDGANGDPPGGGDYKTGLENLKKADLFNLLCLAPFERDSRLADTTEGVDVLTVAAKLCRDELAMLLVDPPTRWNSPEDPADSTNGVAPLRGAIGNISYAAIFFPEPVFADPKRENRLVNFPPSGAMAGVFARTDATRGVWKAPAGLNDGGIAGAQRLSLKLTLNEIGKLNPIGVNCLRSDSTVGNIIWGARTLEGADLLASQWKYTPVRRMALFIEQTLLRSTQWAVFEPNDEPLWSQLRLSIGAFMQTQFRRGAFQGQTPDQAYLVKVDSETTTPTDIDSGIVNIQVGFAPLKPAEFVVIQIQQLAGQSQS